MSNNTYQTQAESDRLNENITKEFKRREFLCHCCHAEGINEKLVYHLQKAHDHLPENRVMIITSGYRCEKHNRAVGGKEDSAHLKGLAADIKCDDSTFRMMLVPALIHAGFKRIGVYKNYIHVDCDESKPQGVFWL